MKFTHAGHITDWEACFENATEDISNFDNTLTELENASFSADSVHWLVSCLSSRARGIQALNIIQQNNPPDEYLVYHKKLRLLLEAADSRLNRLLNDHSEFVGSLFLPEGDLWGQLDHLERQLKTLRRAFQDWLLFQEETDPPDETLRDMAADFLLPFADFYRISEDAPPSFTAWADFQSWRSRFSELNNQFQACFGYLQPVADFLIQLQQREYHADFWWLTRQPLLNDVQEPELSDAWLQTAGQKVFAPSGETCPESGLVIAYAFHELMGQERLEVQNHVRSCSFCLNLVLDLRAAQEEAEKGGQQLIDWTTYLSETRESRRRQSGSIWWAIPTQTMLRDLSHRFGNIINWPQSIPATMKNTLEMLLMAPFKAEALPLMAADHPGDVVIAKSITLEVDGTIQEIVPVTVIVHHLATTEEGIELSGELPSEFQTIVHIDFHFGWQYPDNSFQLLETNLLERKGIYFVASLKSSCDRRDGNVLIALIR